jgi:hypothetical protein
MCRQRTKAGSSDTGCKLGGAMKKILSVVSKNGGFKGSIDPKWFKKMSYLLRATDGSSAIDDLISNADMQTVIDRAVDEVLNKGITSFAFAESQHDEEMTVSMWVRKLSIKQEGICIWLQFQLHEHNKPAAEEYQNFRLYRYDSSARKFSIIKENMAGDDVAMWTPKN